MRILLHLVCVLPIALSPIPLLGRYDDLLACPPPDPAVNGSLLLSALLALLGAGSLVALALTRNRTHASWEDEAITFFVGGVLAFVALAGPGWLIASDTVDRVVAISPVRQCVALEVVAPLTWVMIMAPVCAPVLDGARGLIARKHGTRSWLPWFSLCTVALLFGVWLCFALLGAVAPIR